MEDDGDASTGGGEPAQPVIWNELLLYALAEEDIIDLGMGNPDLPTPQHIVEKLLEASVKSTNHRYSASKGIKGLRLAIANWYLRRSRRRFWKNDSSADKQAAYSTLYTALTTVAKLIAPAMPFLAEELYQNLVRSVDETAPESVHLAEWPVVMEEFIDESLNHEMELVMKLVSPDILHKTEAGGVKLGVAAGDLDRDGGFGQLFLGLVDIGLLQVGAVAVTTEVIGEGIALLAHGGKLFLALGNQLVFFLVDGVLVQWLFAHGRLST